jgi:hypothetical protein
MVLAMEARNNKVGRGKGGRIISGEKNGCLVVASLNPAPFGSISEPLLDDLSVDWENKEAG